MVVAGGADGDGNGDGVDIDGDFLLLTRALMVCAVMSSGGIDGSDFSW